MNEAKRVTIGRLAQRAGVGIDTVRFYERAGLMPPAARTASGYRTYAEGDADRLRFIRRAKALGFTLPEIAELLDLGAGHGGKAQVKALAERRLQDLDSRIRELTLVRDALTRYVRQCSGKGAVQGCPIIETLTTTTETDPCKDHHIHTPPMPAAAAIRRRTRS